MFHLTNIKLLRIGFILGLLLLLLASCKGKKEITSNTDSTVPSKVNSALKQKYATLLSVKETEIKNEKLYHFIDEWYAVPYKYAGFDKSGIDCSGFTCKLYELVYNQKIARSTKDLFANCSQIKKQDLKEGDFVFFKIEKPNVSHVGIYLQNNKFVHASTKKGIIINDLEEAYYKKYFFTGGRIKS